MSFEPTIYTDAYWMSAGESDDTLANNGGTDINLYTLGLMLSNKEIIDFDPIYNNISHQLMGSWSMKNSKGNYNLNDISANYKLTNGEVFYGMLGQIATGEADKNRTISLLSTDVAVGEKPRYNLLTHSGTDKRELFGCVLKDVGISWDDGKGFVEARTKYDALSWKTSTWDGDIFHPGPSLVADGYSKPFSILKTLTWDNTPIVSPKGVGMQMTQSISSTPGTGSKAGMKQEINDSLGINIGFSIGYWGNESAIIADHKSGTPRTLVWRMDAPNTDATPKEIYFEVTASDCTIIQPLPFRENGKTVAYATMIKAETVSVVIQDYLNDYHYTYPR